MSMEREWYVTEREKPKYCGEKKKHIPVGLPQPPAQITDGLTRD